MSDMRLAGESVDLYLSDYRYSRFSDGVGLDFAAASAKDLERLQWTRNLLEASLGRPPRFGCFGLHEWAMVYRSEKVRHEKTPLRLSSTAIEELLHSQPLCCTHHDAFRFFTEAAKPLNGQALKSEDRSEHEQFGCVHFNMDLYRWSYKLSPWIGSELMDDCFRLAIEARTLDMRASPYDLSEYGYTPIRVETPEGRNEYAAAQHFIFEKGQPLAKRLHKECSLVLGEYASEKPLASAID